MYDKFIKLEGYTEGICSVCVDDVAVLPQITIRNGLPDPDSDADRHQNVISWFLGHTPTLHKFY